METETPEKTIEEKIKRWIDSPEGMVRIEKALEKAVEERKKYEEAVAEKILGSKNALMF